MHSTGVLIKTTLEKSGSDGQSSLVTLHSWKRLGSVAFEINERLKAFMPGECFSWKMCFRYTNESNPAEEILFLANLAGTIFDCSIRVMTVYCLGSPLQFQKHSSCP